MRDYYESLDDKEDIDPVTNTPLTRFIHNKRMKLIELLDYADDQWSMLKRRAEMKRLKLQNSVNHLVVEDSRQLTNGSIITATGLASGIIFTKKLSRASRVLVPSILAYICFSYTLPQTRDLWLNKLYYWEKKEFPVWTKKQDEIQNEFNEGIKDCKKFANDVKHWFNEK